MLFSRYELQCFNVLPNELRKFILEAKSVRERIFG